MIVISSSLSHLFQLSLIYLLFYLLTQLLFILFIFSTNSLLFLISHILLYNPLILCFLWLLPPSLSPLLPSPPTFPLLSFASFISYSTLLMYLLMNSLLFSSHLSIDVFPSLLFCSLLSFDVFSSLLFCSLLSFDVFSSVLFSDAGCSGYRSLERHTRQACRSD